MDSFVIVILIVNCSEMRLALERWPVATYFTSGPPSFSFAFYWPGLTI